MLASVLPLYELLHDYTDPEQPSSCTARKVNTKDGIDGKGNCT